MGSRSWDRIPLGLGFGFELCRAGVSPSHVSDSSAPASGQGLSFLAGLGLTVRHPPYLKLVISFLFISAAIQVPLATSTPYRYRSSLSPSRVRLTSGEVVAGMGCRESIAGRSEA